jgi:hypothetical protein
MFFSAALDDTVKKLAANTFEAQGGKPRWQTRSSPVRGWEFWATALSLGLGGGYQGGQVSPRQP